MDIKQLTDNVAVSPQLALTDLAEAKAAGFKSIICNRPDGEEDGQPRFDAIAAAARAHGLRSRYIPVTPGQMGHAEVTAFATALSDLPGPILAYCRSGARSAALFSAVQGAGQPAAE